MTNHRYHPLSIFLVMLLSTSWPAMVVNGQESDHTAAPDNRQRLFDSLRRQAFDAFYNLDYQTSQKLFQQIIEQLPEHPAGYLYMATQILVNQLAHRRRLQADIYSSPSFYKKTEEKVDPEVDRRVREYIQEAIKKARARVEKNDRDVDARYFLGAAYAILAAYEAAVRRKFFSALKHGRRAVSEHRKVIKQDPDFVDAYLTIGIYDYIVGSLPFWVKIFAVLGGIRGSKQRGLQELRRAADQGKYVHDDARVLLIAVYVHERQYQNALDIVRELARRYPRNYYLSIEEANLLVKMGRKREGFAAFEAMLQNNQFRDVYDLLHFQYAKTLSAQGYKIAALFHYRQVSTMPGASPQLVSLAHLRAGQMLDLRGEREAAVAQYQVVLDRENVLDSHEQAQKYLHKPFTGKE